MNSHLHFDEERHRQAKKLFFQTLKIDSAERRAYLVHECGGDEALLQEVLSLMDSLDSAGDFLELPAIGEIADFPENPGLDTEQAIPSRIGPYRIIQVIGDGGMGVVYLAEQTTPVRREVALKVVKQGMDSEDVVARFTLESQALAIMDHPCIASVFDAGTTDLGQPYFAMEYVRGLPITEYCDTFSLNLTERLKLFIRVCEAAQHAHQKGIVHRDIKPNNVLVTSLESRHLPKIIDFGVARATGQLLVHDRARTGFGMIIGTPEYMSPEQVDGGALDIDTRTDIYSLGVLLYELLVGQLPIRLQQNGSGSYSEFLRRIQEEVPDRPSHRVSLAGQAAAIIAERRQLSFQTFRKKLRGDLDWITMKALEKDRTRRYSTASELAIDVTRYLQDEPVYAGPPGTTYLLRKFICKNRGPVIAVLAVILALAAGLTASMRLYVVAEKAKQEATRSLANFRNLADLTLLDSCLEEADTLWPTWPENVPDMERWLERAEDLAGRLDYHLTRLLELREHAVTYDEMMQRRDVENHPMAGRLEALRANRAGWDAMIEQSALTAESEENPALLAKLKRKTTLLLEKRDLMNRQIMELEERVTESRSWVFDDPGDQWLHDNLVKLVQGLERFVDDDPQVGMISDIRRRIAETRHNGRITLEDQGAAWARAISSIADPGRSPQYDGLRTEPQVGLIPLGPDPRSGLWEFAVHGTGVVPRREADGSLGRHSKMGIILILLPGGSFQMGAVNPKPGEEMLPNRDPYAWLAESPVHTVELAPYFISKYELTQAQWTHLTSKNPSQYSYPISVGEDDPESADLRPVEQVNFYDCRDVLIRIGLDLPSEAQWEYAARAGTSGIWHTGNDQRSLVDHVNLRDLAIVAMECRRTWGERLREYEEWLDDGFAFTAPVGSYRPNPFGLHDVHGNIAEWCCDWFQLYECPPRPGDGYRIAVDEEPRYRVSRGGHFRSFAAASRIAARNYKKSSERDASCGVRPVRLLHQ